MLHTVPREARTASARMVRDGRGHLVAPHGDAQQGSFAAEVEAIVGFVAVPEAVGGPGGAVVGPSSTLSICACFPSEWMAEGELDAAVDAGDEELVRAKRGDDSSAFVERRGVRRRGDGAAGGSYAGGKDTTAARQARWPTAESRAPSGRCRFLLRRSGLCRRIQGGEFAVEGAEQPEAFDHGEHLAFEAVVGRELRRSRPKLAKPMAPSPTA